MIDSGSFSGRFDIRVFDANTGRLTKSRSFSNVITNQGLIAFCGGGNTGGFGYNLRACVGNGTSTPSPDDTTLQSHIANSSSVIPESWQATIAPTAPNWVSGVSGTVRFNAGVFNGTTLSEIGITNARSGNPVWCRALILDEHGQPSAITVLANEYLDVTYTLYYHPKMDDTEFQFVMNGVTYNCVARAAFVSEKAFGGYHPLQSFNFTFRALYNTQTLGAVTGEPVYQSGGKSSVSASYSRLGYASEEPYTYKTRVSLSLNQGNFDGGIGAVLVGNPATESGNGLHPQTQISFSPKLPKDANTEMSFTLARTISRYVAPTP